MTKKKNKAVVNQTKKKRVPEGKIEESAIKNTMIAIPDALYEQFEETRNKEEKPIPKKEFYSTIFQNGILAVQQIAQQKKVTSKEPEPVEKKQTPIVQHPATIPVKEEKKWDWIKIMGLILIVGAFLLFLFKLLFPRSED